VIIDHKIVRHSGAILEPCIYKHGSLTVVKQGVKMHAYSDVFVPIIAIGQKGYCMPIMGLPEPGDLVEALGRLTLLWGSSMARWVATYTNRWSHHRQQVQSLVTEQVLRELLDTWYTRTETITGMPVSTVHGDPTLENFVAGGFWLDPSVRAMPLEAEFDAGKLLQSYCGYGEGSSDAERCLIKQFILEQGLNVELCVYYLVTHIVRLYAVQEWAREWALKTVQMLPELVKELQCR